MHINKQLGYIVGLEYTNDLVVQRKAIYVFNTYERTHYLYQDWIKQTTLVAETNRGGALRQKGEGRQTEALQRVQAMEILVEESNVQRVDAPVTVSFVLLQTPDLFFSDVHRQL